MTPVDALAALALAAWLYLVVLHGGFWRTSEREEASNAVAPAEWPRVTAVIPARNEADMIPRSLASLIGQRYPGEFSIVLVDDQSSDGTAEIAQGLAKAARRPITVVSGRPLPASWTG